MVRHQLRAGLSSLPTPKNDFEIVLNEEEGMEDKELSSSQDYVEDAGDVADRIARLKREEGVCVCVYV